MRILFLSFTSGQGHNMACKALMAYLEPLGVQCRMLDALECINPRLSRITDRTYTRMTQYAPRAWSRLYRLGEKTTAMKAADQFFSNANWVLAKRLIRTVRSFVPDAVVCSHVYGAHVVRIMREKGLLPPSVTSYGIVTDFTIHPYWEICGMDFLVLASPYLEYQAVKRGIPKETLLPLGIPVHPRFAQAGDPGEARAALGLADKPTLLMMAGSMGLNPLYEAVAAIAAMPDSLQLLAVCGRNPRLRQRIDALGSPKVHTLGFVDHIDRLMDAADWVITKPGGLSTSEALAKNRPMLLIDPIPGIETQNQDFLTNMGMAMRCVDIRRIDESVRLILDCPGRGEAIRDCQRRFASRESAKTLGDVILARYAAGRSDGR